MFSFHVNAANIVFGLFPPRHPHINVFFFAFSSCTVDLSRRRFRRYALTVQIDHGFAQATDKLDDNNARTTERGRFSICASKRIGSSPLTFSPRRFADTPTINCCRVRSIRSHEPLERYAFTPFILLNILSGGGGFKISFNNLGFRPLPPQSDNVVFAR